MTALAVVAKNTGATEEEIKDVLSGMIVSAKAQHGAKATNAELAVVAGVCATYHLNPLIKEAYAFISGGKLQVMIGLDGWLKVANRDPNFDGYEQFDNFDANGELISVTTKIYIKGRKYPTPHTEYMDEAFQPKSDAWRKYKKRMLAGKSLGQCVRKAFGISEIIDNDEAERITGNQMKDVNQAPAQKLDLSPIDRDFAECGDADTLRQTATEWRNKLESTGEWAQAKADVILLKSKHDARIASYAKQDEFTDAEEAEFTEVVEQAAEQTQQDNEPDVPFE